MEKYKLTKTTKTENGITFYQIEALKDFGSISKGDKGGWIEKEGNLEQDGDARVFGNARVSGNALVYGNAWVSGDALVYGNARVSGDAWVFGNAWVSGDARVCKQKLIGGYFYHTKQKEEKIEIVDTYDDGYETLCREPKLEEEKPQGKKVKIRLSDNKIVEGEIIED